MPSVVLSLAAVALAAGAAAALPLVPPGDPSLACNFLTSPSVSCMLPYPDNFFLSTTWDPSAPPHLTLSNASLPIDTAGGFIDPNAGGYNALPGFSPLGPVSAYLPGLSLDASALPRLWSIPASTLAGAHSVLLHAASGLPVPHWVELDHSGDDSGTQLYERTLMLWPAHRLLDGERYIVAFRNCTDDSGVRVAPSDGFAALLSGAPTANAALEASRPRFAAVFAALEAAGWARSDLTLAWDFTTNTREGITAKMLHMRDDAFARIAAQGGVQYKVTSVEDAPAANTSRRIHGSFSVPCYLPFNALPALDSLLVLDPATGLPVFQKFVDFDFEVVVPLSVAAAGVPAKVLQYGHGLFGDHGEVEVSYLASFAQEHGYIVGATDWIGLSEYDELTVIAMMAGGDGGFTDFRIVPDRLHQGMLNALVLMKLLTQSAFVHDPAVTFGGKSVVSTDPADWHYTGNSQGGIMGGMYMAATTDVKTGVLGVGGGPYALLLPRSSDFSELFDILKLRYPRSMDRMAIMALMQSLWDKADPAGWAGYITPESTPGGPVPLLPGTPSHRVIHHYGLGDHQVTWLGCHAIAASTGAVMFASNVVEGNETLSYFTTVPDSQVLTTGNAVMGADFGFPVNPFINVPPSTGPDAHECPRRMPALRAQMARFFATGEIANTCGGPCVFNGCPSG